MGILEQKVGDDLTLKIATPIICNMFPWVKF